MSCYASADSAKTLGCTPWLDAAGLFLQWHQKRITGFYSSAEVFVEVASRRARRYKTHEIKISRYFVTICAWCKKIRDSEGVWRQSQAALQSYAQAKFSHGICPACAEDSYNAYRYANIRVDKATPASVIRSGKFRPAAQSVAVGV